MNVPDLVLGAALAFALYLAVTTVLPALTQNHDQQPSANQTAQQEAGKVSADDRIADYTWWLTIMTGVLALATVGLLVATYKLYDAGERQLEVIERNAKQQSSDTQASIAVAEAAANAAKRSADNLTASERAYFYFWDTKQSASNIKPGDFIYTVIYKNVGKTPARISSHRFAMGEFTSPPDPLSAEKTDMPRGSAVGANETWIRGKVTVTADQHQRAIGKQASLYLYGEVVYLDVFNTEQRTWYCRKYTGNVFVLGDLTDDRLNGNT